MQECRQKELHKVRKDRKEVNTVRRSFRQELATKHKKGCRKFILTAFFMNILIVTDYEFMSISGFVPASPSLSLLYG